MNKRQQRSEIKKIFEADLHPTCVTRKYNQIIDAVSVEIWGDMILSTTIETLVHKGYIKFNVIQRHYGLLFNVFFKEGDE